MNNGKTKTFDLGLAGEAFGMVRLGETLIAPASISVLRLTEYDGIEIELLSGNKYTFEQIEAAQLQNWLESKKAEARRALQQQQFDPRQIS